MTICLLITKEDIETTKIGLHYQIKTKEGVTINFTPDALDELIADYEALKKEDSQNK